MKKGQGWKKINVRKVPRNNSFNQINSGNVVSVGGEYICKQGIISVKRGLYM